jgi:phage terminase large subunit-like protein
VEFVETFCRHSKGEWAGQVLQLRDWQKSLLNDLYRRRPDGLRQHRTAYIGLPRKNGKSTLAAAMGIYDLVADGEEGAEVYSCAGDRKQAEIVFTEAKRMIEADRDLRQVLKIQRYHIEMPSTHSIYRVLSADAALQHGLNPSHVIFDEVHVQPNEDLWIAMTLGSGTRRQPLVTGITTAGFDENSLAARLYQYGKRVHAGEIDDPTFFFRWFEPAQANCDWRAPVVWAEANPAYGDFLKAEDFEAAVLQTPEFQFRRFRLNQWTAAAEAWLPFGAWEACAAPGFDLKPELPLYVGIDVALYNDSTAVVGAQRQGDRTVVRAKVWENPYPEGHSLRDSWELNIFAVEEYLRELHRRFPVPACQIDDVGPAGPAFCYDPAFFHRSAAVLEGEGLAMARFAQHDSLMIPASQSLYQLVVEGKIAHDGDPVLMRQINNAIADQKPRGWRLTKVKGSRKKIDAAVACAIAVYSAQTMVPPKPRRSAYEDRGVLAVGR